MSVRRMAANFESGRTVVQHTDTNIIEPNESGRIIFKPIEPNIDPPEQFDKQSQQLSAQSDVQSELLRSEPVRNLRLADRTPLSDRSAQTSGTSATRKAHSEMHEEIKQLDVVDSWSFWNCCSGGIDHPGPLPLHDAQTQL